MIVGPGKWTVTFRPSPQASVRLLCFHHAGGGAFRFRPWADELSAQIELVAVQLPGRENRASEPPPTSIGEVLGPLAAALQTSVAPPYAIFGHSLGAMLAYLLACRLHQTSEMALPTRLFLSASGPPRSAAPSPRPGLRDADLSAMLEQWGGTPRAVFDDPRLLQTFLRPLRADMELLRRTRVDPCEPLPVPFTVFRGDRDASVREAHAGAWSELTSVGVEQRELAGGHFYDADGERRLLSLIEAALCAEPPASRGAASGR